ncbi:ATP-binding protein [Candidatus Daviesbacteria bacterium]|nr:ATP-binding protein [Candidatus Daviesbacteria bacterium]
MNPNIKYIERDLEEQIAENLKSGKVILLYGPRRVGKTTLVKHLFEKLKLPYLYLSCEQDSVKSQLVADALKLKEVIGNYQSTVFDEAQYLKNPGLILKVLIDTFPNLQLIASGSSSFELAGKIQEPLTGRNLPYYLFPLSYNEIRKLYQPVNLAFYLEQALRFGSYPETLQYVSNDEKANYLQTLTNDFLYKDILAFDRVKESKKLRDLLITLSLRLGQEVSYNELANTLSIDRKTVEYYIDLLEKTFVLFRLYAFSRNLRSEINRKVKIYFYDVGVRNALINNFNQLDLRNDVGALFENYVVAEFFKHNQNRAYKSNFYFWRTYTQKEIDLVEEREGRLFGYEIKYPDRRKLPKATVSEFNKAYPDSSITYINKENLRQVFKAIGLG